MSEEEKEEPEQKKREGSKGGQQYVSNTEAAKKARKEASSLPLNDYNDLNIEEVQKKIRGLSENDIETLLDYEKNHANRKTLVETLESRL